jgi:hypothetical protein
MTQLELLEPDPEPATPKAMDWHSLTAVKRYGQPEGWKWSRINYGDCPEGYCKVTGGIPRKITKGARKGKNSWGETNTLWMKQADIDAVKTEWESENGKCWQCVGTGQDFAGWNNKTGVRYQTSKRCVGSGKAKQ